MSSSKFGRKVIDTVLLHFGVNFKNIEIFIQLPDGAVVGLSLQAGLGIFGGVGFERISGEGKMLGGFFREGTLTHPYLFTKINKIIILIMRFSLIIYYWPSEK